MIQNVPYLQKLTSEIINHILYLLKPKRFEAGTRIIKRGDNLDSIHFLKSGVIDIYVPKFKERTDEDGDQDGDEMEFMRQQSPRTESAHKGFD